MESFFSMFGNFVVAIAPNEFELVVVAFWGQPSRLRVTPCFILSQTLAQKMSFLLFLLLLPGVVYPLGQTWNWENEREKTYSHCVSALFKLNSQNHLCIACRAFHGWLWTHKHRLVGVSLVTYFYFLDCDGYGSGLQWWTTMCLCLCFYNCRIEFDVSFCFPGWEWQQENLTARFACLCKYILTLLEKGKRWCVVRFLQHTWIASKIVRRTWSPEYCSEHFSCNRCHSVSCFT